MRWSVALVFVAGAAVTAFADDPPEWKEFASLDLIRIRELLKYPIVLDGRNLYAPEAMAKAGLDYHSVGRAARAISHPIPVQARVAD